MKRNSNISQLPFNFAHHTYMGKDDFVVSPCNAEAFALIERWPQWADFAACIYGGEHCGKTHLANIFAEEAAVKAGLRNRLPIIEAKKISLEKLPPLFEYSRGLIVEDLSENIDEEAMFHLFNLYRNQGGFVLFTSHLPPARLPFKLPDLKSRLMMIQSICINHPDDELLAELIVKLFCDRQIAITPEVLNYIVINMQRSFDYAHKLVAEIDHISMAYKRAISIPIVKEAINSLKFSPQGELF